jgi:hypothetical protein
MHFDERRLPAERRWLAILFEVIINGPALRAPRRPREPEAVVIHGEKQARKRVAEFP